MSALPVLFEDEYLAVVDKPAGLMVHDSALARGETDFAARQCAVVDHQPGGLVDDGQEFVLEQDGQRAHRSA